MHSSEPYIYGSESDLIWQYLVILEVGTPQASCRHFDSRESVHSLTIFSSNSWTLKPQVWQDSFGEFNKNFLDLYFLESAGNHQKTPCIRPSCNCFEWHIVMQYCPVANYAQSVRTPTTKVVLTTTSITANNRVIIFASWQLKFTAKFHFSEIIFG